MRFSLRIKLKYLVEVLLISLGAIISAALGVAVQILIARNVAPTTFGNFSSAFLLVNILSSLCGFGIPLLFLRNIGRDGYKALAYVYPATKFIFCSTSVVILLCIAIGLSIPGDDIEKISAVILSSILISNLCVELKGSVLQLEESYQQYALWQILTPLSRSIGILLLMILVPKPWGGLSISLVFAASSFFIVLLSIRKLSLFMKAKINLKGHELNIDHIQKIRVSTRSVMREAMPYGMASLFYLTYYQIGVVLVRYLSDSQSAGYFNIALIIFGAAMMIPGVIYQKYLASKIHRWAYRDKAMLMKVFVTGNYLMVLVGLVVAAFVWMLAPILIPLIFGEEYFESVYLTRVICIGIPLAFLASSAGAPLITENHMRVKVKLMALASILTVALNVIFIPIYGPVSAAYVVVVCNFVLMASYLIASYKIVFREDI